MAAAAAAAAQAGERERPTSSGGRKMFHREFWRPKKAPNRSLSDLSMGEEGQEDDGR